MQFLSKWLDSPDDECAWDDLDDKAERVDEICCVDGNCGTPEDPRTPESCHPACAIAMHDFHELCHEVTEQILGDRHADITGFEEQCLSDLEANGEAIIEAIRTADCHGVELGTGEDGR
eukprot:SAG31_NODE_13604_length_858_cov_0.849802_1_plen_119_part_00